MARLNRTAPTGSIGRTGATGWIGCTATGAVRKSSRARSTPARRDTDPSGCPTCPRRPTKTCRRASRPVRRPLRRARWPTRNLWFFRATIGGGLKSTLTCRYFCSPASLVAWSADRVVSSLATGPTCHGRSASPAQDGTGRPGRPHQHQSLAAYLIRKLLDLRALSGAGRQSADHKTYHHGFQSSNAT